MPQTLSLPASLGPLTASSQGPRFAVGLEFFGDDI